MFNGFFIRKFEFLINASSKTLYGSIKISLCLVILLGIDILERKDIINPKCLPKPLLNPLNKINGLIFPIQLKQQHKNESISMVMILIQNESLFQIDQGLFITFHEE
jgi:hypothetical protein